MRSLANVVAKIRADYPQYDVIMSTFTETGYANAQDNIKPDAVFMLPFEVSFAFTNILNNFNVKLVLITDTELWHNFIYSVSKRVPLVLLNGRISDRTWVRYKKLSFIFAPMLKKFNNILAKSELDAARFREIMKHDTEKVENAGNIKYQKDIVPLHPDVMAQFSGRIAIAASTHHPEEEIFLKCALTFKSQYDKVVIVPRHINRTDEIIAIAGKLGLSAGRYSRGQFNSDVIIVDAFGLLGQMYQVSERIFIGGSLVGVGGHNIFEALQYGKPVVVGKYYFNFRDIAELGLKTGIVHVVQNEDELLSYFQADSVDGKADFNVFFKTLDAEQELYRRKIDECFNLYLGDKGMCRE
ncbi:hypothetical protein AGMMS49941_07810 [Deferribacterales bacterium]|nr:hypothetical protein AGMMS49941_07810 [Deferribacterales bacterium]